MKKLVYPKIRFLKKTAVLLLTSVWLSDSRRYWLLNSSLILSLFHPLNWEMHFVLFLYAQIRFSFLFKFPSICALQKNKPGLYECVGKKIRFCLYKQVDVHLNWTWKLPILHVSTSCFACFLTLWRVAKMFLISTAWDVLISHRPRDIISPRFCRVVISEHQREEKSRYFIIFSAYEWHAVRYI